MLSAELLTRFHLYSGLTKRMVFGPHPDGSSGSIPRHAICPLFQSTSCNMCNTPKKPRHQRNLQIVSSSPSIRRDLSRVCRCLLNTVQPLEPLVRLQHVNLWHLHKARSSKSKERATYSFSFLCCHRHNIHTTPRHNTTASRIKAHEHPRISPQSGCRLTVRPLARLLRSRGRSPASLPVETRRHKPCSAPSARRQHLEPCAGAKCGIWPQARAERA